MCRCRGWSRTAPCRYRMCRGCRCCNRARGVLAFVLLAALPRLPMDFTFLAGFMDRVPTREKILRSDQERCRQPTRPALTTRTPLHVRSAMIHSVASASPLTAAHARPRQQAARPRRPFRAAPCAASAVTASASASASAVETSFHTLPSGFKLEVLSQRAAATSAAPKPPMVFVHGSYHAAWCWSEHFFQYFASRGQGSNEVLQIFYFVRKCPPTSSLFGTCMTETVGAKRAPWAPARLLRGFHAGARR